MYDIFAEALTRLDCREVVEYYTHHRLVRGRMPCPLHGGSKPNFSVTNDIYTCFSTCGKSGDAVNFVQNYLRLQTPLDALKILDKDFNLRLGLYRPNVDYAAIERERRKRDTDDLLRYAVTAASFTDDYAERVWWELHTAETEAQRKAVTAKHIHAITAWTVKYLEDERARRG
jgi:DNA primase